MRYTLLWAALVTVACDHTTAPRGQSTASFAMHLDTLAAEVCAVNTPLTNARCQVLRLAEAAPAAGVAPAPTTVVYNGTEQTWLASVLDSDEVYQGDSLLLNVYDVIAYSDSNLSITYYARFQLAANDTSFDFSDVLVFSDTSTDQDPEGFGTVDSKWNVQTTSVLGTCTLVPGLAAEDSAFGGFPVCQATQSSVVLNGNGFISFFIPQQTIPTVRIVKNFTAPTS